MIGRVFGWPGTWMVLGLLALVGWFGRAPLFDNLLAPVLPKPFHVTRDCWFLWEAKQQIECGYLYVYEDRDVKSGMVRLPVVVVKSTVPDRREDPVLMIEGGPGGAVFGPRWITGAYLSERLESLPWAQNRDVIFYDQRGAGRSRPSLKCPEHWQAQARLWDAAGIEASIVACRDRFLAKGVDLTAYNTTASAGDIEDLRQSLRIDHWNLRGVSYGTRLALTVMRRHPEGIRSAILAGVDSLGKSDRIGNHKPDSTASYSTIVELIVVLLEKCGAVPECASNHPNVQEKFLSNLRVLQIRPVELNVEIRLDRQRRLFKIDDAIYLYLLVGVFLRGDPDEFLPLIEDFSKQRYSRWIDLVNATLPPDKDKFFTQGMFWSVQCNDYSVPERGETTFERDTVSEFRGYYRWIARTSACRSWPHLASRRLDDSPVESGIPTLLLAGALDRITPLSWAKRAAQNLPNGYLFELPYRDHGVGQDRCANALASAFLDDPSKRPTAVCWEALSNAN